MKQLGEYLTWRDKTQQCCVTRTSAHSSALLLRFCPEMGWEAPAPRTAGLPAQTCRPALPYSRLSLQTLPQMSTDEACAGCALSKDAGGPVGLEAGRGGWLRGEDG